jgi:Ca2+-binding EF-hand superfamily protein
MWAGFEQILHRESSGPRKVRQKIGEMIRNYLYSWASQFGIGLTYVQTSIILEDQMNLAKKGIWLLAVAGLVIGGLLAEGKEDRDKKERRGPKGHRNHGMMMMDTDKDGFVSKVEMMNHFDQIDGDGDGLLSAEEMKAQREKMRGKMEKKMEEMKSMSPEERFSKMDKNGDGVVSKDEFPMERAFDKIDADKSGGLSQEELEAFKSKMKERGSRGERPDRKRGKGQDGGEQAEF